MNKKITFVEAFISYGGILIAILSIGFMLFTSYILPPIFDNWKGIVVVAFTLLFYAIAMISFINAVNKKDAK